MCITFGVLFYPSYPIKILLERVPVIVGARAFSYTLYMIVSGRCLLEKIELNICDVQKEYHYFVIYLGNFFRRIISIFFKPLTLPSS